MIFLFILSSSISSWYARPCSVVVALGRTDCTTSEDSYLPPIEEATLVDNTNKYGFGGKSVRLSVPNVVEIDKEQAR